MRVGAEERKPLAVGLVAGFAAGAVVAVMGMATVGFLLGAVLEPSLDLPQPAVPSGPGDVAARISYDARLIGPDGTATSLARFRGRPLVLHFWATWCAPCVRELPRIQALADSLAGTGIEVIAVSDEEPARVRRFLRKKGLRLAVHRWSGPVPGVLRTPGIPATFVIDGDGAIRLRHVGAARWGDATAVRFIRSLRAQESDAQRAARGEKM